MVPEPDATSTEAPVRWLSTDEQRAWIGVSHFMLQTPGALDAQLQRDSGLNLFEYLVLSRLSMTDGWTVRMSQLAALAGGSLSRLSNVVKRLEERGLVVRQPDECNRRFTNATLTEAGWDTVVAAAPGHVDAVRRLVLDPLSQTQISALAEIGDRVITAADPPGTPTVGGLADDC